MTRKLDDRKFHQLRDKGEKKTTVYMNEGHKWMIEEIAYLNRFTQKDVLYDILQNYWDFEVIHTKKME